ncbi:hypothetical protein MHSWG343_10760 [Candidatus Mycoplasma haematohominis]|uniref:Uncharacterized protein n=1 Tax=Candidatus Mycoplasma haematohominis TaxID=1494318 RepID=A0A478FR44_9MOLU|nr:hypothetical protein MHSWG343_10760 [Candidatus Mycoplasma haemohominis]
MVSSSTILAVTSINVVFVTGVSYLTVQLSSAACSQTSGSEESE